MKSDDTGGSHGAGNGGSRIAQISEHVRKYLIVYTILSVAVAIPVGYYTSAFTAANKGLFSELVIFFAILTIYPSMIQLKTEGFARELRSWKPIVVSLIYLFALSPLIAFILAPSFGNNQVASGFLISNVVPASSASLGYVLIAGGSLELATALAIVSIVVAVPMIPILVSFYGSHLSTTISLGPIMMSVLYILVIPLIVGQLTRYALLKKKGPDFVNKRSKKYISLATMLSMFALIFVLVDKEAPVITGRPEIVGYLMGSQAAIIIGILLLSILVSRMMHLSYEKHQAVAFISVSKNQSIAAAIAVLALNPVAALAPSVIPMIQPVLLIMYIHLEKSVRKIFSYRTHRGAATGH